MNLSYTLAKVAQQSAPLYWDKANILHLYTVQHMLDMYKLQG